MSAMVADNELLPIAQIVKSYNTNGEIIIKITSSLIEDLNTKEPVFIYFDELPVPFFIEYSKKRGNSGALIKLETINDISHAEELIKKIIHISSTQISQDALEESTDALSDFLIGCTVTNQDNILLGGIIEYHNYPNNPCIEIDLVNKDGESALIPFNEDLIIQFNPQERAIKMEIPHGLLEL